MRGMLPRPETHRLRPQEGRQARVARARLFALLVVLIPMFGALQALAADGLPRIENELVPPTVKIEVPVDIVVDRIVDRLVFVPIPTVMLHPWPRLTWDISRWDTVWRCSP